MARLELPEQHYLTQRLSYTPETGALLWRRWTNKTFNARFAGKPAFTTVERGYLQGRIDGKLYYAHRVIWKMMTGETPVDVDHENGDRSDNRWCNLRNVCRTANMRNRRMADRNTSGHFGVQLTYWGAWQAKIGDRGKTVCLGSFRSKADAIAAREQAERTLGYHANHGRS